jgi:HAE1 family hydrophobic/amphiphilic exporter-1
MALVSQRLNQENLSLPAGFAKEGHTQYSIRSVGYFKNPTEIPKMPLTTINGRIVTLGQVATVKDATQDINYYTRVNGEPGIGLSVQKQADANTVETANNIKAQIKAIGKRYPNLKFRNVYDQSKFVESSIDDLKQTAIIGGVLAILIITVLSLLNKPFFSFINNFPLSISIISPNNFLWLHHRFYNHTLFFL